MLKSIYWQLFYRRWKEPANPPVPGYSVLVMIPGDLPVFLRIALEVCARQNRTHMNEILVIPDKIPPEFMGYFESLQKTWTGCPMRLLKLNRIELFITRVMNTPGINNWLQFVKGCNEAVSTHVLWHDADLFIDPKDFFETHYTQCVKGRFSCYGVSEVWDPWYKDNGFPYLTSTWELMMELGWVKSFKPWQHRGHDGVINGKAHTFDSTLLPQCLTDKGKIGRQERPDNFVHFNYTISAYRHFQKSRDYEDRGFKIFLIRLLLEMYDDTGAKTGVPPLPDLVRGLKDKKQRVTYIHNSRKNDYLQFRGKLKELINSAALDPDRKRILIERLRHFDEHFGVNEG